MKDSYNNYFKINKIKIKNKKKYKEKFIYLIE
jgi:hypothetical protein